MKVTKLIREYVEEQVSKVYDAKENPYSKQAELDKQMLEDAQTQLINQQQEFIDNFLRNTQLYSYWNDDKLEHISAKTTSISQYQTSSMLKKKNWDKENLKLKNAKIREIILALELGANRQELNDMIAKLLEE